MSFQLVPQPKPRPKILDKRDEQRELDAYQRRVNAAVDARDQKRCRCCGRRGNPYALTALGKIHRAHIKDASLGGAYEDWNLLSLCWLCHALVHRKLLWILGTDANQRIGFEIAGAIVADIFGTNVLPGACPDREVGGGTRGKADADREGYRGD
jgi:hypothetical protein